MIYFDQAASSFPKPKGVADAMVEAVTLYGANPGRGGHALSQKASDVIYETRVLLGELFGLKNPKRIVFFQNATGALNQGIKGLQLSKGDHVITSSYEHNSVRRPLEYLRSNNGIELTYIKPNQNGTINEEELIGEIKSTTKLIIATHGSNLTGMILPIKKIGEMARDHGIKFMVDASQTAGVLPVNMADMNIDMLAFAGHKGLLGPQGTGVLMVQEGIQLEPIFHGGTGSFSESSEQPDQWPERLESGTLNTPGIAGLQAGCQEVRKIGISSIYEHEYKLIVKCIDGLNQMGGITIYGPDEGVMRLGVLSFVIDGIDSHEIAMILNDHYHIAVRAGLHCSPMGHESMGTLETGAVRISLGIYNTEQEVDQFLNAIKEIKEGYLG